MVLTVERERRGFRLHLEDEAPLLRVARGDRRRVEAAFRALGLTIVDEYGARVDASQFEKELFSPELLRDPDVIGVRRFLGLMLTPNWYLGWRHRRAVRQSSDDGEGA